MSTEIVNPQPMDHIEQITQAEDTISLQKLMWYRFRRNKLAFASLVMVVILFTVLIFADFFAPYGQHQRNETRRNQPPQIIRFRDVEGNFSFRPFVYGLKQVRDPETMLRVYTIDEEAKYPIYFFVRSGVPYKLFGLFETDLRLFGVENGYIHLFGTDQIGLDLFSLVLYGGRISVLIALIGVLISVVVGTIVGVVSGYFGGVLDNIVQRTIEVIMSFPRIPLWMALSAALPAHWDPIQVFFGISIVLSLLGWGSLARQLRGKVLALRNEEYVQAARAVGSSHANIIFTDLIPNCMSHIIVVATLNVPGMILAETSLSFLGLGIRRPMVSWGSLLQAAQNVNTIVYYTWYVIPVFFVIGTVLIFNFLGDGLRDAMDPFAN